MTVKIPRRSGKAHGSERSDVHQEWLLDEALKETFPASDPCSPYQPRAIGNEHTTPPAHVQAARSSGRGSTRALWLRATGCALFCAGYVVGRIRR